jgi:methionyl-tRNA formyltransferase
MYMDEGLDTGDVLLKKEILIAPDETGGSLHDRLALLSPAATLEALELIENAAAPRIPQDSAGATYAPKLHRDSGRIDWTESAEVIERQIRAFNPRPGSFTQVTSAGGQRKLKVFGAKIVEGQGTPGAIVRADNELVFAAGTKSLLLTEVQLEGRKRMPAAEFLRGNRDIMAVAARSAG